MRPNNQVKVIQSKLDILKEIKTEVQQLQDYMDNILEDAKSWIDETEDKKTFFELDQYLMIETSICIEKCLHIANENKDLRQTGTDHDTSKLSTASVPEFIEFQKYENMIKKFEDNEKRISQLEGTLKINEEKYLKIGQNMDKHSNKIKDLQRKIKTHEEENAKMSTQCQAMDTRYNLKYDEMLTELQAASNFMSHLSSQNENLTRNVNENKETITCLTQKLNDESIQRVCPIGLEFNEMQNNLKEQEVQITELKEKVNEAVERNRLLLDRLECHSQTTEHNMNDLKSTSESLVLKVSEIENSLKGLSLSNDWLHSKVTEILSTLCNLETSAYTDRNENHGKTEELRTNKREMNVKLHKIVSQVEDVLLQIKKPESQNKCVAVNAYSDFDDLNLGKDEIVKCSSNLIYINGDCFDVNTGIFTAPVQGTYLCCASMIIGGDEEVSIGILKKDSEGEELGQGFLGCTLGRGGSTSVPVFLKTKDQLYLKSTEICKISSGIIQFMCILIN